MASRGPSTAVVVDHWPLIRLGIGRALQGADVRLVGEAARGDEGIDVAKKGSAELLVLGEHLDTPLPDTVRHARRALDKVIIVALVGIEDAVAVRLAARSGVEGMLVRTVTGPELVDAVTRLGRGERCISPQLIPYIGRFAEVDDTPAPAGPLSPKELLVVRALAQGQSNKEIAGSLFLAEATVKTHVSNIIKKLEVDDRQAAVARALELGLLR